MSKPLIFLIIDTPAAWLGLNATEKTTLVSLASHLNAKRNGSEVWPSVVRLADLSGVSVSQTRRALRKIEALGLIKTRTDTGSSNVYSIVVDAVRSLADPGHGDRGNGADPGHGDRGGSVMVTGDPGHGDRLTAKEQPIGTTERFSSIGCSRSRKVIDGDHQRKMALAGIVSKTADRLRFDPAEQPTKKKSKRGAA